VVYTNNAPLFPPTTMPVESLFESLRTNSSWPCTGEAPPKESGKGCETEPCVMTHVVTPSAITTPPFTAAVCWNADTTLPTSLIDLAVSGVRRMSRPLSRLKSWDEGHREQALDRDRSMTYL
jgi:hypothetical protein